MQAGAKFDLLLLDSRCQTAWAKTFQPRTEEPQLFPQWLPMQHGWGMCCIQFNLNFNDNYGIKSSSLELKQGAI